MLELPQLALPNVESSLQVTELLNLSLREENEFSLQLKNETFFSEEHETSFTFYTILQHFHRLQMGVVAMSTT